jgi:hypothetical protein
MVKDWKLAVCTRSRLVLALLSLAVSWVSIVALSSIALAVIEKYQDLRLEQKIERLKVGMTEQELVQIMGKPRSDLPVTSEQVGREERKTEGQLRRLEFYTRWGPLKSGRFRSWVVLLDNNNRRIVEVSPSNWLVEVDGPSFAKWLLLGAMTGLALVIWLLLLRFCRRARLGISA